MLNDESAAERAIGWFKLRGWLKKEEGLEDALKKNMYCTGCRGDRSTHWSPDCQILTCCIDDKKLNNCSMCTSFPCELLTGRAENSERYRKALNRLKELQRPA